MPRDLLEKHNDFNTPNFRARVRAEITRLAYETLRLAPGGSATAAELRRRQVLKSVVVRPESADKVAYIIAVNAPDAWFDGSAEPTDAQVEAAVATAIDVFGDVLAA